MSRFRLYLSLAATWWLVACTADLPEINVLPGVDGGPQQPAAASNTTAVGTGIDGNAAVTGGQVPNGAGAGLNSASTSSNPADLNTGTATMLSGTDSTSAPAAIIESACQVAGSLRCLMEGAASRQMCDGAQWQAHDACPAGQVCLSEQAECVSQDEFCKGSAGAFVCVGSTLHQCDDNAQAVSSEDCQHPMRCELGKAAGKCAACIPGQDHTCEGVNLMVCREDGNGFQLKLPCMSEALCNVEAQDCTEAACSAGQVRCSGQQLQQCNATQTGFDDLTLCNNGTTCSPERKQCDSCTPGQVTCNASGERVTCKPDGTGYMTTPCSSGQHCDGEGQCVECTEDQHCAAGSCQRAICNTSRGKCEVRTTLGEPCASGFCNLLAQCVPCVNDSNCSAGMRCVFEQCERKPACGDGYLDPFEVCDDANQSDTCNSVCSASPPYKPGCGSDESACGYGSSIACFFDTCSVPCTVAGDCPRFPSSESGRAADDKWKPYCNIGQCFIRCTQDAACPIDMKCIDSDGAGLRLCMSKNSPIQGG